MTINYENEQPTISARELHEGLEVKSNFTKAVRRIPAEIGILRMIQFKAQFNLPGN